jgi:hypothetical protein
MFVIVLPDTVPVTFAVALASEWLKLFEKVDVAVPPLLAATLPLADAVASPELLLLLSVFVVVVVAVLVLWSLLSCVLWLLLSCVLLSVLVVVFVVVAVLVFVLLLLLSVVVVFVLLLLLSWVLLSVDRVVVWVAVLPLSAVFVSWACALSENASEIAVTSKVLFIRVPLWV